MKEGSPEEGALSCVFSDYRMWSGGREEAA